MYHVLFTLRRFHGKDVLDDDYDFAFYDLQFTVNFLSWLSNLPLVTITDVYHE